MTQRPVLHSATFPHMQAITLEAPGGPEMLRWGTAPDPVAGPGEVLVDVAAAGVNRADLMQRQGHYPPPPGASEIIGLECSGHVAALGEGVTGWRVGDAVCALLAGGGYAERVVGARAAAAARARRRRPGHGGRAPRGGVHGVVERRHDGRLAAGETFLVQGGTGGIGTHAIQVAKALGARVAATAGAPDRLDVCRELGADIAIDYHDEDFAALRPPGGRRHPGQPWAPRASPPTSTRWRLDGRLVIIGMQGGDEGRAEHRQAAGQAGQRDRDEPARAAGGRQGRDRRGGARARLADDRRRAGAPDRRTPRCRCPTRPPRTRCSMTGGRHRKGRC